MTESTFKKLLTKNKFRKYLQKNSSRRFPKRNPEACAIAQYLMDSTNCYDVVVYSGIEIGDNQFDTSKWARQFIEEFDKGKGTTCTGATALKLIPA